MSRNRRGLVLLVVSAAAIGVVTLTPGEGSVSSTLCFFCGDRGLADFLSNVVLFVPFGAAVGMLTGSPLAATAVGLLFSLAIETAQVTVISARDANAGDLVANGLGALVGWGLFRSRGAWFAAEGTWRRAFVVACATLAAALVGLSLLRPSFPERTYFLQWTARFEGMHHYDGRVQSTSVGGLRLAGPWQIDSGVRVRTLLAGGAPLQIEGIAGNAPGGTAPVVSIFDDLKREIVLVGADGIDLVYRYRTVGNELLLDRGELRIAGALRDVHAGSPLRITVQKKPNGYCVEVNSRTTCGVGFTVADTWALLAPVTLRDSAHVLAGLVWLCCLFVPCGLLIDRKRTALLLATMIVVVLLAGPFALGFILTPPHQVAAALAGIGVGMLVRAAALRARQAGESGVHLRGNSALPLGSL